MTLIENNTSTIFNVFTKIVSAVSAACPNMTKAVFDGSGSVNSTSNFEASQLTDQGPVGRGVSGPSCENNRQPPRMDPLGFDVSA